MVDSSRKRKRIDISGRVQGVGFRPFIYRIAKEENLAGLVGNNSSGVFIEIEGAPDHVARFLEKLRRELPPLAYLHSVNVTDIPAENENEFAIKLSDSAGKKSADISPDVSTCDLCLAEVFKPDDRRAGYPFTNCTNCGPRYSIIQGIPYDRPQTTMKKFIMCPQCQSEYDDPGDRRFHAQPNACSLCGPRIWLCKNDGTEIEGDPFLNLANFLKGGMIAAIKGLGGFHLAVRADFQDGVETLRARKGREAKPFAMMAGTLEEIQTIAEVSDSAKQALLHWSKPIVLLPKKADTLIAASVAPDTTYFGMMLPYTPFHHLLFSKGLPPLVMTSGNPSDEPLCNDNEEALRRLQHLADVFVLHDRDIERRIDDSVMISLSLGKGYGGDVVAPLRRSRGFVPEPIHSPISSDVPILAVGGEMKSTVCVHVENRAVLSEHLGELSNPAAYRNFVSTIDNVKMLLDIQPEVIAHDMHPKYASAIYAKKSGLKTIEIQHHHAHLVSCMADNMAVGEAIGVCCDGTGYGTDGQIWGCEVMAFDNANFKRFAHLDYFPLVGGDSAAKYTWKPAASILHTIYGPDWLQLSSQFFTGISEDAIIIMQKQLLMHPDHLIKTSSLGRLFDAVSFLLGVCDRNRYEAEAPIKLENTAQQSTTLMSFPHLFDKYDEETFRMNWRPLIEHIIARKNKSDSITDLARAFHNSIADMLFAAVQRVSVLTNLRRVVLSGGSFVNRLLLIRLNRLLMDDGFEVLIHRNVPAGDGGLALGQAVIAAERINRGIS